MSEENVEIVRRIYAAWTQGSPTESGLLDPGIEWVNPDDAVEPGVRVGVEAFGSIVEGLGDTFEDLRVDFDRFIDAGDRVVVIGTLRGRGRESGVEAERRQGYVWTIREGRAVRFEWYNRPEEAFEATGLDPNAARMSFDRARGG
jgi:ketosteroid isomerase-like protein